jgi:hypothetical protein
MQNPLKLAIGAAGGLVVAVGVVAVTAAAAGVNLTSALHSSPSPTPVIVSSPSPPPGRAQAANPAARLVNQAVIQAEAQVLGLKPADLTRNMRQGMTVHQLATQKGIGQADFEARFTTAVSAILDQDVQQGQLTSQQEQQALKHLSNRVPNWDAAPGRAQAQPSPSPA